MLDHFGKWFLDYYYTHPYIWGDPHRLDVGNQVSLQNTVLNLSSGKIVIGDYCVFGHNCMLLTGKHKFSHGKRLSLSTRTINNNDIKVCSEYFSTIDQLAKYLNYSKTYLKRNILNNLPFKTVNGKILYPKVCIDKWIENKEAPIKGFDIIIEEGCWIASGVIIIGAVTIGKHSIIGSGSIVTKDIPRNTFAAGIPARPIKSLLSEELHSSRQ